MIELIDILNIAVVGSAVSLFIEYIKNKTGNNPFYIKLFTIILSIILGAVYYFYSGTELFISIIGVLSAASTIWALIIKGSGLFEGAE